MNSIESFKRSMVSDQPTKTAPEGYCPNCWGREEYGGKFYTALNNQEINSNNIDKHKGWVLDYAEKNLGGIKLKTIENEVFCPTCQRKHQQ